MKNTRVIVERVGAIGDCIILTPLLRYLKEQGNEVYLLTSAESGVHVFANNPYIDELIPYVKDTVPIEQLLDFCKETQRSYKCDKLITMSESLEVALLLYPYDPVYSFPKADRIERGNKNIYDYAFEHAGYKDVKGRGMGELYFTDEEKRSITNRFRFLADKGMSRKYIMLWGLSGSGRNKALPMAEILQMELVKKYPDLVILTMGDVACKLLETIPHPRIIHLAGETTIREMLLLPRYANLVFSPDTGLLHAAGACEVDKIGLLGHNTKEHVSKYFENDYSIEAQCECAPCFKLIYQADVQCPIDPVTRGCWCMARGFDVKKVFDRISSVIERSYYGDRKNCTDRELIVPAGYAGGQVVSSH